jgi:hypothetical protein
MIRTSKKIGVNKNETRLGSFSEAEYREVTATRSWSKARQKELPDVPCRHFSDSARGTDLTLQCVPKRNLTSRCPRDSGLMS